MNKKLYNVLGLLCSSCLAWFVFFDLNSVSALLFGELEKPKSTSK